MGTASSGLFSSSVLLLRSRMRRIFRRTGTQQVCSMFATNRCLESAAYYSSMIMNCRPSVAGSTLVLTFRTGSSSTSIIPRLLVFVS